MHAAPAIFENVVGLVAENSTSYHSVIEVVYLGVLKTFVVLTILSLMNPDAIQCTLDFVQRVVIQIDSAPYFSFLTIIFSLAGTVAFVGVTEVADIEVAVADEGALAVGAEIGALSVAAVIQVTEPLAKQMNHGDNQFDAFGFVDPAAVLAVFVAEMIKQEQI